MALINQNSIIGVTSITSPSASNVLTVHTNDTTERLRVSTSGLSFSGTNASLDTSGNATFNGNVSIGGTLTYEDVTNIDSVGIITARSDIHVGVGLSVVGIASIGHAEVSTAQFTGSYVNVDGNLDIADSIRHLGDNNTKLRFPAADTFTVETAGSERLRITGAGVSIAGNMQFTAANPELEFNNGGPRFRVPAANTLTIHTGGGLGATSNERLRITSDGDIGIGTDSVYGISRLSISPDNRQTQFSASAGATWHDVVIKQNDTNSSGGNAVGLAFEISTGNYHNNAGTGIAAIKDSNSTDYGCHLAFITRPHSAVAEERMRIHATGEVTKSAQPRFLARLTANTSYNPSNFGNYVDFDVEDYDIGGNFTTSGADQGLFTAPVAGMYLFQAAAYAPGILFTQSWFIVNATRKTATDWVPNQSGNFIQNSQIIQLNVGDKVGFHPHKGGTTSFTINHNTHHTYFKGCLLG